MGNCADCGRITLVGHFKCRVCGECVTSDKPAPITGPLDIHDKCTQHTTVQDRHPQILGFMIKR